MRIRKANSIKKAPLWNQDCATRGRGRCHHRVRMTLPKAARSCQRIRTPESVNRVREALSESRENIA